MGKRVSPTLIGIFVVGAVVLAVVAVAVFGSGRLFRKTEKFVVYFEESVNGLKIGAPVKFKGVEIGSVADIVINLQGVDISLKGTKIPVVIEIDQEKLAAKGSRVDLTDAATLEQMIAQGLRARLEMESFVTGVLYVALDVRPETPVNLLNLPGAEHKEIPTIPTALEQMRSAAAQLLDKLDEIEFDRLVRSATEAIEGLSKITNSPKVHAAADSLEETLKGFEETMASIRKLADNANATIARLEGSIDPAAEEAAEALREAAATMRALRAVLEPDSPTMYKVGKTLDEVSAAARGIRELTDYLERNPSSLLRGKEIPEEER